MLAAILLLDYVFVAERRLRCSRNTGTFFVPEPAPNAGYFFRRKARTWVTMASFCLGSLKK